MSDPYASNFGFSRSYGVAGRAAVAVGLEPLQTPSGVEFSNGAARWRIRMEADNNLTLSFSTDNGQTYVTKYVFNP